jgi:hypothetical protein
MCCSEASGVVMNDRRAGAICKSYAERSSVGVVGRVFRTSAADLAQPAPSPRLLVAGAEIRR